MEKGLWIECDGRVYWKMIKNFSIPTSLKLSGWSTLIETGPKQGLEVKQIYVHDVQNKIEIFNLVHPAPHFCNPQWPALCNTRAFTAACFTFYNSERILGVIAPLLLHLAWCPRLDLVGLNSVIITTFSKQALWSLPVRSIPYSSHGQSAAFEPQRPSGQYFAAFLVPSVLKILPSRFTIALSISIKPLIQTWHIP